MKVGKKQLLAFLIGSVLLLTACGGKKADNTYHDAIAALPENTYSATVDIGLDKPVLLVTDGVYDDGNGNEAAIYCDVYYPVGKKVQKIGTIESMGTAYPIAFGKDGIYAALDRGVQKYAVDSADGKLVMTQNIYVSYDTEGTASYFNEESGTAKSVSVSEYDSAQDVYAHCVKVDFKQKDK